jgi:pimeloyl-ACP methyl ester carboxylesterase
MYEPPLLAVVPDGEGIVAAMRGTVGRAIAEGGPRHAMAMFIRMNAGDEAFEQWRTSADPDVVERVLDNGEVFFSMELPAFARYVPDAAALRASGVPLTVLIGADNRDTWFGAAAAWLTEYAGVAYAELPGGHGGFATHPTEFVATIRRLLG